MPRPLLHTPQHDPTGVFDEDCGGEDGGGGDDGDVATEHDLSEIAGVELWAPNATRKATDGGDDGSDSDGDDNSDSDGGDGNDGAPFSLTKHRILAPSSDLLRASYNKTFDWGLSL